MGEQWRPQNEEEYQKQVGEIPKSEQEWDDLMENAKLEMSERDSQYRGRRPDVIELKGEIKGHKIILSECDNTEYNKRYNKEGKPSYYFGKLDGVEIEDSTAERLFKKYLPTALAQNPEQISSHIKSYKDIEKEREEERKRPGKQAEEVAKTL